MIQEKEFTRGLSTREAEKRIKTYGLNELKHNKKKSPILIFLFLSMGINRCNYYIRIYRGQGRCSNNTYYCNCKCNIRICSGV